MSSSPGPPHPTTVIDIGPIFDEGRWSGYQQVLVVLTALTIVFDGADIQLLGIALPAIMSNWSLPRTAFAPVLAVGFAGMMIGGAAAGILGDRYGRKSALLGSVFLFGLATLATSFANNLLTLAALRLIVGVGLGGAIPNATALAAEYVPRRRRPFAVTLTIVCVPLGGTLAGLFAIGILPAFGWRTLFAVSGLIPLLTALLLVWLMAESPRYLACHPRRWPELRRLLHRIGHPVSSNATFIDSTEPWRSRSSVATLLAPEFRHDTVALWVSYVSCLFAVYLGFNWIPSMLTGVGLAPTVGSTGIAVFNLGGVAGAIVGALAFARVGSKPTMLTMAAGAVAGAFVMSAMHLTSTSAALPIVFMLGITGGLINAVQTTMYALAAQIYPTAVRATGVGAAVAIGRTGAIASTYAGAWALESGGSSLFFWVIAAAMLVSFVALASIRGHIKPSRGLGSPV